ncbi:hypothetical protein N7499_008025 [Penicillium canescens]|nr:hypothetical protein N7499_008025 [Penicillium canescens]KAJ6158355.1 hypothetical protein N7485_011181 [Penicillium canescens]
MAQSNPLSAVEVEHVPLLPEYPSTHQDGYAYIVNLRHMTLEEKGAALWGAVLFGSTSINAMASSIVNSFTTFSRT